MAYKCTTCGETVRTYKDALKHSKQGYRTSREAFQAGARHTLRLIEGGDR